MAPSARCALIGPVVHRVGTTPACGQPSGSIPLVPFPASIAEITLWFPFTVNTRACQREEIKMTVGGVCWFSIRRIGKIETGDFSHLTHFVLRGEIHPGRV